MDKKLIKNILIGILGITIIIAIIIVIINISNKNTTSNDPFGTMNKGKEISISGNEHSIDKESQKPVEKKSEIIDINEYNSYSIRAVTEENLLREYLEDYKQNALKYPEYAYNSLDEEYRNEKFGNIDYFKEYINNRKDTIEKIELSKYKINDNNGNIQYICLDNDNNYYIFNKKSNMKYTVILDTYTIDLDEFTQKYIGANDGQKVGLNVEKFFKAINDKDYKYAYNKLDETFRNNNFPTLNDFVNYANNNFFEQNKVEHLNAKRDDDELIIYTIDLKDATYRELYSKRVTVVMQLKQGTEYVMSFSM